MDFAKAIAILITGIFSLTVINGTMVIAPLLQAVVDRVFIGIKRAALGDQTADNRLAGFLLNIVEHVNDHLTTPLKETEHGRFLSVQSASPTCAFQSSASAFAPLLGHGVGMPFMTCHNVHLICFNHAAQLHWLFFATTPSRNCVVMACTSSLFKSSSAAICWFDRFSPMKYKHNTQTRNG